MRRSFKLLGAVAAALKATPEIRRLAVHGHTDNKGDPNYNLDLSGKRAEAVRAWLAGKGGVYVKERCTKTIQGRALVVERNLFRQAGQDERSFVDETRVTILRARSERNGFELNRFGQALLSHGPHSVRECPSSRQKVTAYPSD